MEKNLGNSRIDRRFQKTREIKLTIRSKLTLGFLFISILVGIIGIICVYTFENVLVKTIGKSSITLSVEVLDKIKKSMNRRIIVFQDLSKTDILQNFIRESNKEFHKLDNIKDYIDKKDQEWISTPKEEIIPFMNQFIHNILAQELRRKLSFYEEKYGYRVFG